MTHNFSLLTDAEMENLITQVYESLPNPDQSRLSLIENKLLYKAKRNKSQKNLNKIPWWFVLLLAGGFVSATWWVGELLTSKQNIEIIDKQSSTNDKVIKEKTSANYVESSIENNSQENEPSYEDRESPVIYQRELF